MDRHKYVHIRNVLYGVVEGLPTSEPSSSRGTIRGNFPGPLNESTMENLERSHGKYDPSLPPPSTAKNGSSKGGALFRLGRRKTDRSASDARLSPSATFTKPMDSPSLGLEKQESPDGSEWLIGEHIAGRTIRNCYNPSPDGGVNVLNEYMRGSVPGLGQYEIRCWSDVVSDRPFTRLTFLVDHQLDTQGDDGFGRRSANVLHLLL